MAKKQKVSNNLVIGLIGAFVIALSITGVMAYSGGSPTTVFEGDCVNCTNEAPAVMAGFGAATFSDGDVTDLTDLRISDEFSAAGEVSLTGTTTLQEITYGSRYSDTLVFTAGSTTTPGGLFSEQNPGLAKICSKIELNVTTNNGSEGVALAFSVTTSTAASTISAGNQSLIASTTLATTTTALFTNVDDTGSSKEDSWIWGAGVFILGQFDDLGRSQGTTEIATSSAGYTDLAGFAYWTCHTQ